MKTSQKQKMTGISAKSTSAVTLTPVENQVYTDVRSPEDALQMGRKLSH